MSFIKVEKESQVKTESLTVEQKNLICDLFAEGANYTHVKKGLAGHFTKPIHHLIKPAMQKMKEVEQKLMVEMLKSVTPKALKTSLSKEFPDCDSDSLEYLINKILNKGTKEGTFTKYKSEIEKSYFTEFSKVSK